MTFIYLDEKEIGEENLDNEAKRRVGLFKSLIRSSFNTQDYVSHITQMSNLRKIIINGLNSYTKSMAMGIIQDPTAERFIQKKDFYSVSFSLNTLYRKIPTTNHATLIIPINYALTDQTYLGFENGAEISEKEIAVIPKRFFPGTKEILYNVEFIFHQIETMYRRFPSHMKEYKKCKTNAEILKKAIYVLNNKKDREGFLEALDILKKWSNFDFYFAYLITDTKLPLYHSVSKKVKIKKDERLYDVYIINGEIFGNDGLVQYFSENKKIFDEIINDVDDWNTINKNILASLEIYYERDNKFITGIESNPIASLSPSFYYDEFIKEINEKTYFYSFFRRKIFKFNSSTGNFILPSKYIAFTILKHNIDIKNIKVEDLDNILKKALKDLAKARIFYGEGAVFQKKAINIKISEKVILCLNIMFLKSVKDISLFDDKPVFIFYDELNEAKIKALFAFCNIPNQEINYNELIQEYKVITKSIFGKGWKLIPYEDLLKDVG